MLLFVLFKNIQTFFAKYQKTAANSGLWLWSVQVYIQLHGATILKVVFKGLKTFTFITELFGGVSFKMLEGSNPELLQRGLRE